METKKILLVEDAIDLANAVMIKLRSEGMDADHAADGQKALEMLATGEYSLMLLDINLPKLDGFGVASAVKELDYDLKIIAITARDGIQDKLKGFDLGFDDYVTKPFDMRELVARIKVVQGRESNTGKSVYDANGIILDTDSREVVVSGKQVELTKLEFELLLLLMERSPAVVTNSEIIDRLWGEETDLLDPPVRSHMKNLRRKLGDEDYSMVKTVPGVGYKISEG